MLLQLKTLLKQLQSMRSAVEEGNCTRKKRRHSSTYGVVTAFSTNTGKALDVEIMSKDCKESTVWRGKEGSPEFQDWWEGHQHFNPLKTPRMPFFSSMISCNMQLVFKS